MSESDVGREIGPSIPIPCLYPTIPGYTGYPGMPISLQTKGFIWAPYYILLQVLRLGGSRLSEQTFECQRINLYSIVHREDGLNRRE